MSDAPTFYLHSFVATEPDSTVPVADFANGADIRLRWQSNGTEFLVYAARETDPVYRGTEATCLVRGRAGTTTFVLAASVAGGNEADPHPGFETISLYDTLTVTVRNPDETPRAVTAGTLAVSGQSQLRGDARLGNATVGGTLEVTGPSTLSGGATAASLTVAGTVNVQGATNLTNAMVRGALNVTGAASVGAATVTNLTVTGSVTMMAPRAVAAGNWYTASTDGILVGAVSAPANFSLKCSAVISGYSASMGWVYATGGNSVVHWDGRATMWGNANSFAVPVLKGTLFTVTVSQMGGKQADAPTSAWWVPFGRNATLTTHTDAEAAALGAPSGPPPMPPPHTSSPDPDPALDPDAAIDALLDVLREMLGGRLPRHAERQLTDALRSLADA